MRYEYRARELNTDGKVIQGASGTTAEHAYAGSFDTAEGVYNVSYLDEGTPAGSQQSLYTTTVTNSFVPTVRYAEKQWDLSGIPENFRKYWKSPEITMELQYQKADGTYQCFS